MTGTKAKSSRDKYFWTRYIAAILLFLMILPFIHWYVKKPKLIDAVIVDKTVPNTSFREHKGLMWILNNLKIFDRISGAPFLYDRDYYGFFPLDSHSYDIRNLPQKLEPPDLIYLADTYGVYDEDFYTENLKGNRSKIIYGGISAEEVKSIKNALGKSTLLIAEFNTFATPTDKQARELMEEMLGVKWSGWTGRYFPDLSSTNNEVPGWLIRNYEEQYKTKWNFKGPGFALVDTGDRVIILREGIEVGTDLMKIVFDDVYASRFNVENNTRYYYWFDILEPLSGTTVMARYRMDTTESGKNLLAKFGLKDNFPAVIFNNKYCPTYYLAGDYSDNSEVPFYWNSSSIKFLRNLITSDNKGNPDNFFWNVYYPLLARILDGVKHD